VGAALDCHLQYNADLFDATTIERMARNLEVLFALNCVCPS
jgi:hypothetical protein